MYGLIYLLKCKINQKVYVGQTTRSLQFRVNGHVQDAKKQLKIIPVDRAINKYGIVNFEVTILDTAETQEELDSKEEYWIKEMHSKMSENGYNLRAAGSHGVHSEETKKNMSIVQKQIWDSRVPEFRANFSEMRRKVQKGKKPTDKTRLKMSQSQKGRKHSQESKLKIKQARSRKIRCVELTLIFDSIKEAKLWCKKQNLGAGIDQALAESFRVAGGFHWEYAD